MSRTIIEHDAVTGQTTEREMTEEELAQYEADKAAAPKYPQEETPTE